MRVCVRQGSKRNTLHQAVTFVYLIHAQGSHTLVVASDGVWDVVSAEAVAAVVKKGEKGVARPHGLEGAPVLSTAFPQVWRIVTRHALQMLHMRLSKMPPRRGRGRTQGKLKLQQRQQRHHVTLVCRVDDISFVAVDLDFSALNPSEHRGGDGGKTGGDWEGVLFAL
jgi:hypothetical protein